MRLPGPGELDDGVPAPGLDPVLGGVLQHLAGVGPGVGVVVPGLAPGAHPATQVPAADPSRVMVTSVSSALITVSISPRPVSPSGSVSVVATVPPAPLSLYLLEDEAERAEEETQPHDVCGDITEWFY